MTATTPTTSTTAQEATPHFTWKQKLAGMVFGLLFGILIVEVVLRVLPQLSFLNSGDPQFYAADEKRGWRVQSNIDQAWYDQRFEGGSVRVRTDPLGNRWIEPPDKPGQLPEYRILLLGDSYTFGWGVASEETFGAILQDRLNASFPERRIRVINSGVPAYGPQNELETLKQLADIVKPQLVVLGFTENDFENAAGDVHSIAVKNGWLMTPDQVADFNKLSTRLKLFALQHSALARLAYHVRRQFTAKTPRERGVFRGYTLEVMRKEPLPEVAASIQKTKEVIGEMARFCDERHLAFQVFSFPRSFQIYQAEFSERLRTTGASPDDFSPEVLSTRVRAICDELAVPHASVQSPFDAARQAGVARDTLFIRNDGHWSRQGHEMAARAMLPITESVIRESLAAKSVPEQE
jgi:hypothetical protein